MPCLELCQLLLHAQVTEDEFANANYPITKLHNYPHTVGQLDYLLCTGHFNALHVYHDGKVSIVSDIIFSRILKT